MKKSSEKKELRPPQTQSKRPGEESKMIPHPQEKPRTGPKLQNRVAVVTGGDSGIGRAVCLAFAEEGCDTVVSYLDEHQDAEETRTLVEEIGRRCFIIPGDVGSEEHCQKLIKETISKFGRLDILVNNAAEQHPQDSIEKITSEQLERTFRTNIFSMFYLVKAALPHLKEGSTIINTTSVTAYRGSPKLLDYSSTKGAIVSFTRSLSTALADQKIRVNAVAPGPIWTPLIPSTFPKEKVATFGSDVPLKRAGEPNEVAPCFVFLASEDSSYMTGQVLHPNGGEIING